MTRMNLETLVCACLAIGFVMCEPPISTGYGPPAAPISSYGPPGPGQYSNSHDNYDNGHGNGHGHDTAQPYEFGYQVRDDYTGNHHDRKEQSDGNQVRGEYRVQLPDGRTQIVTYYADWQTGFHADVRYEGEAQYPKEYKTYAGGSGYPAPQTQYGPPSNQYGPPAPQSSYDAPPSTGHSSGGIGGGFHSGGGFSGDNTIGQSYDSQGGYKYKRRVRASRKVKTGLQ